MVAAPNFGVSLLRRSVLEAHPLPALQESRQPARSSAPPSGPRSPRPHRLPTSIDRGRKRIGHLFWRVRSFPSRFAAGRSRPQQETFRRPTAILVDPATPSAALVRTDFARQSPSPKARPVARNLRAAVAVVEPLSRSLPAGGSGKASSKPPKRPAEAQAA
jgi:hypothetical protein